MASVDMMQKFDSWTNDEPSFYAQAMRLTNLSSWARDGRDLLTGSDMSL